MNESLGFLGLVITRQRQLELLRDNRPYRRRTMPEECGLCCAIIVVSKVKPLVAHSGCLRLGPDAAVARCFCV